MSLPNNSLSTTPVVGNFVEGGRIDRSLGGIGLNDPSQGHQVQYWQCFVSGDEVKVSAPMWPSTTLFEQVGVEYVSLTFDQNMQPTVAYVLTDGTAKWYWFDAFVSGFVHSTLPAGSITPRVVLDDKRARHIGSSDVLLVYLRSGTLYFRSQDERYQTERTLASGIPAAARLGVIQMNSQLRMQFEYRTGTGNTLADIVRDICGMVDVDEVNVGELASTEVRGFLAAQQYPAVDALRLLMTAYTFDMAEADAQIDCTRRGKNSIGTILRSDLLQGEEATFISAREQAVEYPRKLHLTFQAAEQDYIPTKATSEVRSPDLRVVGEQNVEMPINFTPDESQRIADILHKQTWTELDGTAEFTVDERWVWLTPADVVFVEFTPNVLKRMRIEEVTLGQGSVRIAARADRQTVYVSNAEAPPRVEPVAPKSFIPGPTVFEYLDLPALITAHDTLHYYAAARGTVGESWFGSRIQREVNEEFATDGTVTLAENMGTLEEALPSASQYFTDEVNTALVKLPEVVTSCTRTQLLNGKNAILIGNEILQFQTVTEEGVDPVDEVPLYRLSSLTRGRLDTTPAAHSIGARAVVLLGPVLIPTDPALLGTDLTLRAASIGGDFDDAAEVVVPFTGNSQKEWAPVRLVGARNADDLTVTWVPRYRLGSSANPIQSTHFTGWRIKYTHGGTTVTKETDTNITTSILTAAEQTTHFGAPQASIDVQVMALNSFTGEGRILSGTV